MTADQLHEIEPQRRASVAIAEIGGADHAWRRTNRRPSTLSAREALLALAFESMIVSVAASNVANGEVLGEVDLARLWTAQGRISAINDEVNGR